MRGAAAAALVLAAFAASSVRSAAAEPAFTPGGSAQIRDVMDGATLALADGRVLRLVGIETPLRGALGQQAKAALKDLVSGGTVDLRFAGNPGDRQGRVLAQIYAGALWVQGELLRRGFARVHGVADNRAGIPEMLALERQARRYHRGIWSDRAYVVLSADDAAQSAGTFQLVDFTVAEVVSVAGQIIVSAGADRRSSLALTIAAPVAKLCRDAGLDPMALKGKRILVRGFIDGKVHPRIAISFPEQIELLRRKK
jgi:micrococcal nuclease